MLKAPFCTWYINQTVRGGWFVPLTYNVCWWQVVYCRSPWSPSCCSKCIVVVTAGLRPNWVWCCCPENGLFSSSHSTQTKSPGQLATPSPAVHTHTHTTVLRPFFQDHPGEPVPEEYFWTFMVQGKINHHQLCTTKKKQKMERKILSILWPCFTNRPNGPISRIGLMLQHQYSIHLNPALIMGKRWCVPYSWGECSSPFLRPFST